MADGRARGREVRRAVLDVRAEGDVDLLDRVPLACA
jgi:hypothetical protein